MTQDAEESIAILNLALLIVRNRFPDVLIDRFGEPDYLRRSAGEIAALRLSNLEVILEARFGCLLTCRV